MYYRTLENVDPVPFSVYKSQILVRAKLALNQIRKEMYLQIIVTLRYQGLCSSMYIALL